MTRKIIVLSALVVALIGLLYYAYGGRSQTPAGQAPLAKLSADNFPTLRKEFNDARESVRVILLLSPT